MDVSYHELARQLPNDAFYWFVHNSSYMFHALSANHVKKASVEKCTYLLK